MKHNYSGAQTTQYEKELERKVLSFCFQNFSLNE